MTVQLLILLGMGLKMSFWSRRAGAFIAGLCMLFSLGILHRTVEIPQHVLLDWMQDYHRLQDIAVCLVLDVALQVGFCMSAVRQHYAVNVSKASLWCHRLLLACPCFMLFGCIFLTQVKLLGLFPGQSFWITASMEGLAVALLLLLLQKGFKQWLPQADNRLELLFLVQVLVGIVGILTTVCGNQPL